MGTIRAILTYQVTALAYVGLNDEFVAVFPADVAVIGRHYSGFEPQAIKNPGIGIHHGLIGLHKCRLIAVETVGILHGKLTNAQQGPSGSQLIAKFLRKLIDIKGQVFVRQGEFTDHIDKHLFRRPAQGKLYAASILDRHQAKIACVISIGFLP